MIKLVFNHLVFLVLTSLVVGAVCGWGYLLSVLYA